MGGAALGKWAESWTSRRMLLYMQCRRRRPARQAAVLQSFQRLYLPKWDKDFIRRCLWKKLPVGTRMERNGGEAVLTLQDFTGSPHPAFRRVFWPGLQFSPCAMAKSSSQFLRARHNHGGPAPVANQCAGSVVAWEEISGAWNEPEEGKFVPLSLPHYLLPVRHVEISWRFMPRPSSKQPQTTPFHWVTFDCKMHQCCEWNVIPPSIRAKF